MNITKINLLKALINGKSETKELMEILGIKDWQLNAHVRDLVNRAYIEKIGTSIKLKENAKTILLLEVAKKLDIEKLLHESNELVISYLTEPKTTSCIERLSGLSRATVYRAISELESIGAVEKEGDLIVLNKSNENLLLLAKTLEIERREYGTPNAEIVYHDENLTIKKVLKSKAIDDGALTAFSLFSDYGVEYHTTHDYYAIQKDPLTIQDILIHSILISSITQDKLGLIISIVFYLKNKPKMDVLQLRELAKKYHMEKIWLDIELYLRKKPPRNAELFLPWDEFLQKAKLYGLTEEQYSLPVAYPTLFEEIGGRIFSELNIYLIGGENMRIKGLKAQTKDCDIIIENKEDYERLMSVLVDMGYKRRIKTEFANEDMRIYPDEILEHPNRSRIDLFTKQVLHDLSLSKSMIDNTHFIIFDDLKVGLLRNEHVFVLKAIAGREGDIQDMEILVQNNNISKIQPGTFDWDLVWNEIMFQEKINPLRICTPIIFDSIDLLAKHSKIMPPFFNKLRRHVLNFHILRLVRGGRKSLKYIVEMLEGDDISEQMIRNRIDSLVTDGLLIKQTMGKVTFVLSAKKEEFPEKNWEINENDLEKYLVWRFPLRERSTTALIKTFHVELRSFGYKTIGELDNDIILSLDVFDEYEHIHFPKKPFRNIGAARICIRLANEKVKNIDGYQISEYEKFRDMVRAKFIQQDMKKELIVHG